MISSLIPSSAVRTLAFSVVWKYPNQKNAFPTAGLLLFHGAPNVNNPVQCNAPLHSRPSAPFPLEEGPDLKTRARSS